MRIFKNRWIAKFAAKHSISDSDLIEAVRRADNGLIDADLGGGVIKQRIARKGAGQKRRLPQPGIVQARGAGVFHVCLCQI